MLFGGSGAMADPSGKEELFSSRLIDLRFTIFDLRSDFVDEVVS